MRDSTDRCRRRMIASELLLALNDENPVLTIVAEQSTLVLSPEEGCGTTGYALPSTVIYRPRPDGE